jgi:hypothetical protein
MSDYKVVESQVNMNNKQRVVTCVEDVLGASVKLGATITNVWSHTKRVDIAIAQSQLPENLRGFGDIGLVLQNGKFNWVSISEGDARLIDSQNSRGGRGENTAQTFFQQITEWQQEVENAYAAREFFDEQASSIVPAGVRLGMPKAITDPTGEVNNAWGIPAEVDEDTLRRMGIQVPASY